MLTATKMAIVIYLMLVSTVSSQVVPNYITEIASDSCQDIDKDNAKFSQYYDSAQLSCKPCAESNEIQTKSVDGLTCVCKAGYQYRWNFDSKVYCTKCADNEIVSSDGWECMVPIQGDCPLNSIKVERQIDGSWQATPHQQTCLACTDQTTPNTDRNRCVRCSESLSLGATTCTCASDSSRWAGGFCFPSNVTLITGADLFAIPRIEGTENVVSQYFQANLQAAHTMCQVYGNVTACQILANMCVLILYNDATGRICYQYQQLVNDRVQNLPQLYYTGYASDVIETADITDTYTMTPAVTIPFVAAVYSLNGKYLKTQPLTDGLLQLCETTETVANAAFIFGTYYSFSCNIKALGLWDTAKYPLYFYDIFLKYTSNGQKLLYKVPLRFMDLRKSDRLVNEGDIRDWVITRRMFLVDNQMTVEASQAGTTQVAKYVRYAKDITISMALQSGTTEGKIKAPYFTIKYADISRQAAEGGASVQVSFSVKYTMSWSKYYRDFQISCGTLGTLSLLYAGYRTWVWSKRAGRPAIDFPSIINFFFYLCGAMSNCFFVISFGVSFYWFIFFKRQDAVYLLHPEGGDIEDWLGLASAAFVLRFLSLVHMIVMQCTMDIFFIDWERPRGISRSQDGKKTTEVPVSIWRTFFVANEWNEIQAVRKINKVFQIFATVFFLEVVKFVDTTTKDPDGTINKSSDGYKAEQSFIYRYALAIVVYLVIGVVQWIFFTFIYERFVEDKVQQFVDLCSMSNISVFIMSNAHFGYYIHGRSVHGKADTDMREVCEMMKREEENLCGQRGLVPDTEGQTFMMSIPRRLRLKYDQVYLPAALEAAGAVGRMEQGKAGTRLAGNKEKSIEAYNTLNRFLCGFIDHSLRDVDYVVKDKTLLESIMGTEFFDASEKGIFYNDNGHSFDQVLFYGNEMSLILFDVLLFCMVDFIWMDYVLDGFITYIIAEVVCMIRDTAGRKNLVRKTLVDERFLI